MPERAATTTAGWSRFPEHYTPEFGEGDGKQTLAAALRTFLSALPQTKLNRETAVKPNGTAGLPEFAEGASHHERALAVMEAKGISYAQATKLTADY